MSELKIPPKPEDIWATWDFQVRLADLREHTNLLEESIAKLEGVLNKHIHLQGEDEALDDALSGVKSLLSDYKQDLAQHRNAIERCERHKDLTMDYNDAMRILHNMQERGRLGILDDGDMVFRIEGKFDMEKILKALRSVDNSITRYTPVPVMDVRLGQYDYSLISVFTETYDDELVMRVELSSRVTTWLMSGLLVPGEVG